MSGMQKEKSIKSITILNSGSCDWLVHLLFLPGTKIWKHSDSSDSDSIKLMTPLITQFFQFSLHEDHKHSFNSSYKYYDSVTVLSCFTK